MHSLTIWFGPGAAFCQLLFKTEESLHEAQAKSMSNASAETHYVVTDDYGQTVSIRVDHMLASLLEDLDQSQMAAVERALHNARSQAKAQDRAMTDPAIKESLRRQQQGPAVMSPIPGGRFNG